MPLSQRMCPHTPYWGGVNKVIKKRFDDKIIQKLLEIKWWDCPLETIKDIIGLIAEDPTMQSLELLQSKLCHQKIR